MKKSLVLVTCAAAALLVSGCGGTPSESSNANTSSSSSASPAPVSSKSDSSFEDGVLTTREMKIAITDHKVIPVGEKGNEYGKKARHCVLV